MEPIYCPNGHPNRPGTRLCIVCRALIPPSPAGPTATPPPVAPPPKPARPAVKPPDPAPPRPIELLPTVPETPPVAAPPTTVAPPRRANRSWLWLLAGLLVVGVLGALFLTRLWPGLSVGATPPTGAATAPAVGDTTASLATASPAGPATATDPPPTAAPPSATAPPAITTAPTAVATITPLPVIVGVVVTPTLIFEPGDSLLQNGEFTDDWVNGWVSESNGQAGLVEVRPLADEPGVPALHMERTGAGLLQVGQRVVLTTPIDGLVFRARVRLSGTWSPTAEGRAAVILRYEDAAGQALAATVWLDGAVETSALWGQEPLPPPGPTTSVRFAGVGWQDLALDLRPEFDQALTGVDALAVRQITILLVLLGGDDCGAMACGASLDAAALSLSAGAP